MVPELLLITTLSASAGGIWFLVRHHQKEREAVEREQKVLREQFRETLMRTLRRSRPSEFKFSEFVEQCQIRRTDAELVAESIYRDLCLKVVKDGVITDEKRQKLVRLAKALEIEGETAARIELEVKADRYRVAVSEATADGVISEEEIAELESIRKGLGLGRRQSLEISAVQSQEAYLSMLRDIVKAGPLTPEVLDALERLKKGLAITEADSLRMIHNEAAGLYRMCFTMAVQDGVITPEEKRTLDWLQSEAGLSDLEIEPYRKRLRDVERLAEYRQGKLPSVKTRKLLEGGELCHWDGACRYRYQTAKSTYFVDGELIVTSKRVIFSSPSKNFSYSPAKIMDVQRLHQGIGIRVNGRLGSGDYLPGDPEELEAIIV